MLLRGEMVMRQSAECCLSPHPYLLLSLTINMETVEKKYQPCFKALQFTKSTEGMGYRKMKMCP